MAFTDEALQAAADRLECSLPAIKAVSEVESSGTPFWTINGEQHPPVRLEAHWFGKLTGYKYNASHPNISSTAWNPALAANTHEGAYQQLAEARALDEQAALQSCSWGAFQIMGFHWKALGYPNVQAMVAAMDTEAGQLDAFARFIHATPPAHDALQRLDWQAFENAYNGGGYNGAYAAKMVAAYERAA